MSSRTLTEEIVMLRRQLEEALEENRYLKEQLIPPSVVDVPQLGLSNQEWRVFNVIFTASPGATSKDSIYRFLPDDSLDLCKLLGAVVHRIRKKLKAYGVGVYNVYGAGYGIDAAGKARLDELLNKGTTYD